MKSKMPVLFIGHGNPMNAIEDNDYTKMLHALGKRLPKPKAIVCISAHWMTKGTWLTSMPFPKTIHDFYGFPKPLFDVQYPAPGSPELAEKLSQIFGFKLDSSEWGLDHGTWAVLKHLYPKADIPVIQLSLSALESSEYHYKCGEKLKPLRDEGILIIGSGNIVHNLRTIDFASDAKALSWAVTFDEWVKERLLKRDFSALIHEALESPDGKRSHPSHEHWLPLLYTLGAADKEDELTMEFEGIQNASISMRSLMFQ